MTLIECFTAAHVDNVAACLRLRPQKLIMVGDGQQMCEPIVRYRTLLQQRGICTEIVPCDVGGMDLEQICVALGQLVRRETQCVIDLTGGEETVILAVGAVLAGLDRQKQAAVRVERFDHATNTVIDCTDHNRRIPGEAVTLTVQELIELHGGSLHPQAYQPAPTCGPRDLAGLWSIVADAPKNWNQSITRLNEFEKRGGFKPHIELKLQALQGDISNVDQKEEAVRELLGKLQQRGVIDDESNRYTLDYTYRSPMLRYCTKKAGNVLEVKTLLEGRAARENGVPLFHDGRMSVSIDWDGEVHPRSEKVAETRNEIDVVMMHDTVPLFISCKNGTIEEDELYKLNTVASRFGGPYARKMLIAADLEQKGPSSNRAFVQRAWDMDILLVTDAAELSAEEWQQIFQKAVQ